MKIGILFTNTGCWGTPEGAAALAEAAEKYEIESLWTAEHVVFPAKLRSPYPYSPDGKLPTPVDNPVPDPFIWMAWVAARTHRVKLATGIVIVPQRSPLVMAKEVASLDHFCEGRLILGVGAGWLREEFEALGVPWEQRGRRLDEYLEAMRVLWRDDPPSYRGERVAFEDVHLLPKPLQSEIPICIGGDSPAAARRAGRLGDQWFPARMNVIPEVMPHMRRAAVAAGRNPDAIEITTLGFPTRGCLDYCENVGVHRIGLIPPEGPPDQVGPQIERMLDGLQST